MKWQKAFSINNLHQGALVAFTTIEDDKVIEMWNEQFTVVNILPNTKGKIEILLKAKNNDILSVYWDEINSIYYAI